MKILNFPNIPVSFKGQEYDFFLELRNLISILTSGSEEELVNTVGEYLSLVGGTMSGAIVMGSKSITGANLLSSVSLETSGTIYSVGNIKTAGMFLFEKGTYDLNIAAEAIAGSAKTITFPDATGIVALTGAGVSQNWLTIGTLGAGAITGTSLSAGTGSITGNLIYLPTTGPITTPTGGVIYQNNIRLLHSFTPSTCTFTNTFIGESSGNFTLVDTGATGYKGSGNVGIGQLTLNSVTTGYFNLCIGGNAGQRINTGSNNVFMGYVAGAYTTSGSSNLFLGAYAGYDCTTSYSNIAIGAYALSNLTTYNSYENVAVGFKSGYTMTQPSVGNILLGSYSGYYETGSNKLIVDSIINSEASRNSEANQRLSAILYGVMNTTVASQTLVINAGTSIGNATTSQTLGITGLTTATGGVKIGAAGGLEMTTNDLTLTTASGKTLVLSQQVWEDIRIVPSAFDLPGSAYPTVGDFRPTGAGTTFKVYQFARADLAYFTVQIPHSYAVGSDIKVHVHWTPRDRGNEENGKVVAWKVDYSWANIDGTFPVSATADCSDTCNGTDDRHEMSPDVTIDGHTAPAKGISSMLLCKIYRDDVIADNWVGTTAAQLPCLLEVDFHFPIDTIGSRSNASK